MLTPSMQSLVLKAMQETVRPFLKNWYWYWYNKNLCAKRQETEMIKKNILHGSAIS
jgi:hypothetical protein